MVSIRFQIISLPIALVVKKRREKRVEIHTVAENEEHLRSLGTACLPCSPHLNFRRNIRQPLRCEYPKGLLRSITEDSSMSLYKNRNVRVPSPQESYKAVGSSLTNYEHPSQVPLK